jgi:hypothetical protein
MTYVCRFNCYSFYGTVLELTPAMTGILADPGKKIINYDTGLPILLTFFVTFAYYSTCYLFYGPEAQACND